LSFKNAGDHALGKEKLKRGKGETMTRTTNRTGLVLVLALAGVPVMAQNQAPSNTQSASSGQSLGEYARRVRKTPENTNKSPKFFDNDNLPKNDKLSIVGTPSPSAGSVTTEGATTNETPATGETKPATPKTENPGANPAEDKANREAAVKQWTDRIGEQQQQIDLLSRELDVAQREYQLRAAAIYADAGNRLRNSGDWDKQDAQFKQQIADKQKAVGDAKAKLDELKDAAQKAGMPPSVQEPAQTQPAQGQSSQTQ